jgi:hypothetical protein
MSNKEDIDKYCSYFKERLEEIKTIQIRLYCKILIVAIIDSLARTVYPNKGNKERFISFIRCFSDWEDCNRVSLLKLLCALNSQSDPKITNSELKKKVEEKLRNWQSTKVYWINEVDLCEQELKKLTTNQNLIKLIEESKHAELLYTYRNHLVHEFREPGYPIEPNNDENPCYRGQELVYPVGFFVRIAEKLLANLKHYLEENDLNPYSSYQFGSIWRSRR